MEMQIDTSILNHNNKLLSKIEESTVKDLTEFSLNSLKSYSNDFLNFRENYLIRVDYLLIERFSQVCIVLYGEIIENNQTVYEYKKSEKVFAYTNSFQKIQEILKKINQKNSGIRIETDEFEILKFDFKNDDSNNILCTMTHLGSIVKIFFAMKKFKFNQWENILICSKFFQESFLLKKILNLIGYSISIYISDFLNEKKISKEELKAISIFEEIELIDDKTDYNSQFFDFILETSTDFYENKLKYFNYLKNQGNLILIQDERKINSNFDISKIQFDPRDFEVMRKKSLGMNICNLQSLSKFNYSKGRELNFINQIFEKLISSQDINSDPDSYWKFLVEKLSIEIHENSLEKLKDITTEILNNSINNINLFILNKN